MPTTDKTEDLAREDDGRQEIRLYVGTMNDGLFIIDQPPRCAPNDIGPHNWLNGPNIIAKMAGSGPDARHLAAMFAAAPSTAAAASVLLGALEAAQATLRPIAVNGRKYGAIYSHAMQTLHKIDAAIKAAHAAGIKPNLTGDGERK